MCRVSFLALLKKPRILPQRQCIASLWQINLFSGEPFFSLQLLKNERYAT
jgi:hypothetical protein